jgi:CRP/FNR family cyclic AMP-dependent transcriptional regulator
VPLAALLARVDSPALADTFLNLLPGDARAKLLKTGRILEVPHRQLIFGSSDIGRVGVLLAGLGRTYLSARDGRQFTIRYVRPGEIMGNNSGASAERAPLSAAAVTDCVVLELDFETLGRLVVGDALVGVALIREMNRRIEDAFASLAANTLGSMHERVAWHLLDLAIEMPEDGRFFAQVTQQQLADHIGTAREVVARVLREFRAANIVMTFTGHIEICDPTRLAAIGGRKSSRPADVLRTQPEHGRSPGLLQP